MIWINGYEPIWKKNWLKKKNRTNLERKNIRKMTYIFIGDFKLLNINS